MAEFAYEELELSLKVKPPSKILIRQAEALCERIWQNPEGWSSESCYFDSISGSVFISPKYDPQSLNWGLNDYTLYPQDADNWTISANEQGMNEKYIVFTGSNNYGQTNSWGARSPSINENVGTTFCFKWFRPSANLMPTLILYPRMDESKITVWNGYTIYFAPFFVVIDTELKLKVFEYPYDTYDPFISGNFTYMPTYTHPIVVDVNSLANEWVSISFRAMSNSDILISSNALAYGGFVYRSSIERTNIKMLPSGFAGILSPVGGVCHFGIFTDKIEEDGVLTSPIFMKGMVDDKYPKLRVWGWDTTTYWKGDEIDEEGSERLSYSVYAITRNQDGSITRNIVVPEESTEFQEFQVEITLKPNGNVSPTLNDVVVYFSEEFSDVEVEETDISEDVISITENIGMDLQGVEGNIVLRNLDGKYNEIANRPVNCIDFDLVYKQKDEEGEEINEVVVNKATLYTRNLQYSYYETPEEGALKYEWSCGDGFTLLKDILVYRHPPYDGMLLHEAIKDFMKRIGFPEDKLSIEETTIRLHSKVGSGDYLFKPEDGSSALDFLEKLKEWFGSIYMFRFEDDKFVFKSIPTEATVTFYTSYEDTELDNASIVYKDAKVEVLMEEFYNEIWVIGKQFGTNRPIAVMWRDDASQTDPNSANYIGRRKLMIVVTKISDVNMLYYIINKLQNYFGQIRARVNFKTFVKENLYPYDLVKFYGSDNLWIIENISNTYDNSTFTRSHFNRDLNVICGSEITITSWYKTS